MPTTATPILLAAEGLPASACPPVPSPGQYAGHAFSVAGVATGANPPVSEAVTFGLTSLAYPNLLTRNAARADLLASLGGAGCWAIAKGLTLAAGVGLTVTVSPGVALIDGPVELAGALTQAVPDNSGPAWVWLLRGSPGGQPTLFVTTSAALPASPGVLLGSVTTAGGAVTGLDNSGVMTLIGGQPTRRTADAGPPTDSPAPDTSFRAITASGTFEWNGAAYVGGAGYRTVIVGASFNTPALTPGVPYLLIWDFSAAGHFGNAHYDALLSCPTDPHLRIAEDKGQKGPGVMAFTLHYESVGGSTTPMVCAVIPSAEGTGYTSPTLTGITGTWAGPRQVN